MSRLQQGIQYKSTYIKKRNQSGKSYQKKFIKISSTNSDVSKPIKMSSLALYQILSWFRLALIEFSKPH